MPAVWPCCPSSWLAARILLKSSLKAVPFFGWAMQSFLFIFIDRGSQNRDRDLGLIRRICSYLSLDRRAPNTLILFPEGTDLSDSNLEKDRKWVTGQAATAERWDGAEMSCCGGCWWAGRGAGSVRRRA